VTFICSVIATLPAYVIGIILVVVFAIKIKLLPSLSYVGPTTSIPQWLRHIILPGLALSFQLAANPLDRGRRRPNRSGRCHR